MAFRGVNRVSIIDVSHRRTRPRSSDNSLGGGLPSASTKAQKAAGERSAHCREGQEASHLHTRKSASRCAGRNGHRFGRGASHGGYLPDVGVSDSDWLAHRGLRLCDRLRHLPVQARQLRRHARRRSGPGTRAGVLRPQIRHGKHALPHFLHLDHAGGRMEVQSSALRHEGDSGLFGRRPARGYRTQDGTQVPSLHLRHSGRGSRVDEHGADQNDGALARHSHSLPASVREVQGQASCRSVCRSDRLGRRLRHLHGGADAPH